MKFTGVTFVLASLVPALGFAASPDDRDYERNNEARALSDEGMAHFRRGEYDQAISAFQKSFDLLPAPALLFDLGQAYRRKGDCAAAGTMYRKFEELDPSGAQRANLSVRIEEMEACAKARHDANRTAVTEPIPAPKRAAGLSMTPNAAPAIGARTIDLQRESGILASNVDPGRRSRIVGATLVGIGLAALAGAAYASTQVVDARDRVSRLFRSGGTWDASWDAVVSRGQRYETASAVLYAGAAIAVGTGIVLYYFGHHRRSDQHPTAYGWSPPGGFAWTSAY